MTHKNILIAIDSSDEAGEVVSAAKDIAGDSGAALALVTVIPSLAYAYGADYSAMAYVGDFEREATEQARTTQDALEKELGITCDKSVVLGRPATEIRNLAESSNADLIVIGSHARHGLGLILGSTANGVLHGAPCDVFVVRITG